MSTFNYIDTKFLAINGDLNNTVSGGTAMLQNQVLKEKEKFVIRAKLPTIENEQLRIEIINNQLIISAYTRTVSDIGIVFDMPFGSKAFRIPEGVKQQEISAFENKGYLVVEMPFSSNRNINKKNIDINFDDEF